MTTPAGFMQDGSLVTASDLVTRLERVGRLDKEKCEAVRSGDWITAITSSESIVRELREGLAEAVNLGRTVGGMSDREMARLRRTSTSAVVQRFGARSSLGSTAPPPQAAPAVEQVLYRLYDLGGVLLYVGITCRFLGRLADHKRTQSWWPAVVTIRTERYPDRASVEAAERAVIVAESPLHNIRR